MPSGFMGLVRGLFGSKESGTESAPAAEAIEHEGYLIRPAPRRQGSSWLTAGSIAKQFPDGLKEHQFVRADTFADRETAATFAVSKARQIIAEQGDRMFGS
ncbi:MAG: HlyU family transcriptional regulator [Dongiaceae bacterium]